MDGRIKGKVIQGDGIAGFEFGVPTANLDLKEWPEVGKGVYAAVVEVDSWRFQGVVSYGGNPLKFEVHLLNFDGDLVGRTMTVELLDKVSEFLPWNTKERLRQKILHDVQMTREIFRRRQNAKKAPR